MSRTLHITRWAADALHDVFPNARTTVRQSSKEVIFEDGSVIRYVDFKTFDELVFYTRGTQWDAVIAEVPGTVRRMPEFRQLINDLTK